MRQALYPGTFDPPTLGHLDLIERGSRLFARLVVGVAGNPRKSPLLAVDERVALLRDHTAHLENVHVDGFGGLVVDYARKAGLDTILRGLRTTSDFEFEYQMALTNRALEPSIDTVFVMPSVEYAFLSSSLIKEVVGNGGDAARWVPADILEVMQRKLRGDASQ